MYILYMNDKLYGRGDLRYMHELITDHLLTKQMYGAEEVSFQIVKRENIKCQSRVNI